MKSSTIESQSTNRLSSATEPITPLSLAAELAPLSETVVAASQPYVGRWSRLVSTTNWEKGRIIVQWRESLISQGLNVAEYSDEAWGQLVGGVTGQHVGRLRRVWQRFGTVSEQFAGLYWSHFQAALDWNDAEMWLEGAVQNGWSVALMRDQGRWQTLGSLEAERPEPQDAAASETDEDFESSRKQQPIPHTITGEYDDVHSGPRIEGPDFGDEDAPRSSSAGSDWETALPGTPVELVRPFEALPNLPDDLADAFETMKLAILHHKADNWQQIAAPDMLRVLDALKSLVTAPSSDQAPF